MTICPAEGCTGKCGAGKLVCYRCWKRLPAALGRRLYATWADGDGYGTTEYENTVSEVLAFLAKP